MNTKHTPGPWMYTGAGAIKRDYTAIGCTDGETIASAWGHSNSGFFVSEEEKEANARLIAAAPEMLVALEKLASNAEQSAFEDWLERKSPSGDAELVHRQWKESSDFQTYADEWRHALDAIEKATGANHVHDQ